MSGFEFFFSFYGLILGLAMAELLSGFAAVARVGRLRDIGWGTALLGLEVAFEILIFWLAAWHQYKTVEPSIRTLALPFVSGAIYFIAAGIVFPGASAPNDDLDGYFMAHKRKVATCLLIVFLAGIVNELHYAVAAAEQGRWAYLLGYYVPFNLSLLLGYLVLIVSRSRRWSIGALLVMLGWFVYVSVVRGY